MPQVPGYSIGSTLHEGARSLVYRAVRNADDQPVVLKTCKIAHAGAQEMIRFRREADALDRLKGQPGKAELLHFFEADHRPYLVLEAVDGVTLESALGRLGKDPKTFLSLVLMVVNALDQIHRAQIIHNDIQPSNLLINLDTSRCWFVDFSSAAIPGQEKAEMPSLGDLQGSLAFISPERTGRMNRVVDVRSDYYSLGVVCYFLLVQQLPFAQADPIEMIHHHLAKNPKPPHEQDPGIPRVLSAVVMKLLAKNPDDRYQSCAGLAQDLQKCLAQLNQRRELSPFVLGEKDIRSQLQVSQKLYGRENELAKLQEGFEQVSLGGRCLTLISGSAGIGKSALMQEARKAITRQHAFFITGRFERLSNGVPYSAITAALRNLVQQLLMEHEERVRRWKESLFLALGANASLVANLIPELTLMMGPQAKTDAAFTLETTGVFFLVFQKFINVFAQPDHPLVLFLDDIQWADPASVKLIQTLQTSKETHYLYLICAYRDHDIPSSHPLVLLKQELHQQGESVSSIELQPISLHWVHQLLMDSLQGSPENTAPLAELLYKKTAGNPFFLHEFLNSLHQESLLWFDQQQQRWCWDLDRIQRRNMTDNVAELMIGKISRLQPMAQRLLKIAACIGLDFDFRLLSNLGQSTVDNVEGALQEALLEGLILPQERMATVSTSAAVVAAPAEQLQYRFAHDHIQHAALSLMSEMERLETQYQVGRWLLQSTPSAERAQRIFDIVNPLNKSISRVVDSAEKIELVQLNLMAGKKAKGSAAYTEALRYLTTGIDLLPSQPWKELYPITLDLYNEAAECAYLSADYQKTDVFVAAIWSHAENVLDLLRSYIVKVQAYSTTNQLKQAVYCALEYLDRLGIKIPREPKLHQLLLVVLKAKWKMLGRRVEDLKKLPEMKDPHKLAAMQMIAYLASPAYVHRPELLAFLAVGDLSLSIRYGNAPVSPSGYTHWGTVLGGALGDLRHAYQFGQLAMHLVKSLSHAANKGKAIFIFNCFLRHNCEHLKETLKGLMDAYHTCLEEGDFEYAGLSYHLYCYHSLFLGKELSGLEREFCKGTEAIRSIKMQTALNYNEIHHQALLNLMGRAQDATRLCGEVYDYQKMLPLHQAANDKTAIFDVSIHHLILGFLFGDYVWAAQASAQAFEQFQAAIALAMVPDLFLYDSLTQLALASQSSSRQRRRISRRLAKNQRKMKKWVKCSPMNHAHKLSLMEAERFRVWGRPGKAMEAYDRAIEQAKQNGYQNGVALAYELAGKFYLSMGRAPMAKTYLQEARQAYQEWGAWAKVQDLDAHYSEFLGKSTFEVGSRADRGFGPEASRPLVLAGQLDIGSVLKASQSISSEMVLDTLLSKLMRIVIENAGAERGFLILKKDDRLVIEARALVDGTAADWEGSTPVAQSNEVSSAVVHYVARTKETVVLDNAVEEGEFTRDGYIVANRPKSVLCLPIMRHGDLTGVLYLENNKATASFTRERIEVLSLIASQAAISLDNAKFYTQLKELSASLEQTNQELAKALEASREGARIKSEFLANTSHELRTPLNAIINIPEGLMADFVSQETVYCPSCQNAFTLEEGERVTSDTSCPTCAARRLTLRQQVRYAGDPDKTMHYLRSILTAGNHLLGVVNDILDISKLESGRMTLRPEPIDLKEVAVNVLRSVKPLAEGRNIVIEVQGEIPVPDFEADRLKLAQVMINLIGNAIKFSPEHQSIILGFEVQQEDLLFWVQDHGIGIDEKNQELIFESFRQIEGGDTRKYGGTGLGLAICKMMVELHHGRIWVESKLGQGCTFFVRWPLKFQGSDVQKSAMQEVAMTMD